MIIGGPALRLTTPSSFHVWLVLDAEASSIDAFAFASETDAPGNAIGRATADSRGAIRLGDRLFLYLLEVRASAPAYPRDRKFHYDVVIDGRSLSDPALFHDARTPTYGSDALPSLVIPTKHARILQLSCRKPHGGSPAQPGGDMSAKADELVGRNLDKPATRPTLLLMTGDQIYADDVEPSLLEALIEAGQKYTGWSERMPPPDGDGDDVEPAQIPLTKREGLLSSRRGFSSPKRAHHLMTFGEYLSMYLAVWGGIALDLPPYERVLDRIPTTTKRRPGEPERHGRKIRRPVIEHDEYEEGRRRVGDFLASAWKLRRAMANTPTYTIFDDHEVSDDWNLSEKNRDGLAAPGTLGRRLQSNALAAYWVCQGFGNAPGTFNPSFLSAVPAFLAKKKSTDAKTYEKTLLAQYWGYRVDGFPLMFVLDTRTRRAFLKSSKLASLMDSDAIAELAAQIRQANGDYADASAQSLLVVSPAPVLGFKAIERLQLGASFLKRRVDGEPWIGNTQAFLDLTSAIAGTAFSECAIVSGDVHYAYVRKLDLTNAFGRPLELFQFTSSATNNAPSGVRRLFLEQLQKRDLREFNRERTPYLFPVGDRKHFLSGDNNIGVLELEDGRPVRNVYYFGNAATGESYQWEYDLASPDPVAFP